MDPYRFESENTLEGNGILLVLTGHLENTRILDYLITSFKAAGTAGTLTHLTISNYVLNYVMCYYVAVIYR